jgi:hypothetical protein
MQFDHLSDLQRNRVAGDIIGHKPCKYGERLTAMSLSDGYLTLRIDKSTVSKKGGRETTATRTRAEVWAESDGVWTCITSATGPESVSEVLSFYVPSAVEIRAKRLHHRLGGILTRDGYTVKSA